MSTSEGTVTAAATSSLNSVAAATGHASVISSSQSAFLATFSTTSSPQSASSPIAVTTPSTTTSIPTAVPSSSSTASSPTQSASSSIAVTATSTAAGIPTAAPSSSITHSTGFKAGVSVGGAAGLFLLLLALFFWRRKRRSRPDQPAQSGHEGSGNYELSNGAYYGSTQVPALNPYTQPFPLSQPPNDERGPADSRSRSNFALVPDHDQEHSRPQPNLQHAPALNPYTVYTATTMGAAFGDQDHGRIVSPPPSYMTEDPATRTQTPRSRRP